MIPYPEGGGIVGAANEVLSGAPAAPPPPSQDYSALLEAMGGKMKSRDKVGKGALRTKLGGSPTAPDAMAAGQMGPPDLSIWQKAMRKFT